MHHDKELDFWINHESQLRGRLASSSSADREHLQGVLDRVERTRLHNEQERRKAVVAWTEVAEKLIADEAQGVEVPAEPARVVPDADAEEKLAAAASRRGRRKK